MFIAGTMAIYDFPLDTLCLRALLPRVQALVLWLDPRHLGRRNELQQLIASERPDLLTLIILDGRRQWNAYRPDVWREPMLRALDNFLPDFVLQPDSDEQFAADFDQDFKQFTAGNYDLLMLDYAMPTADDTIVTKLPGAPHCKAFRWRATLSFTPYRGYCKPIDVTGLPLRTFPGRSRIQHYCFYTPELQQQRLARMPERKRARYASRIRRKR